MKIPIEVYDKALPYRFAHDDEVKAFHVIAEWARKEGLREAERQFNVAVDDGIYGYRSRTAAEVREAIRVLAEGDHE